MGQFGVAIGGGTVGAQRTSAFSLWTGSAGLHRPHALRGFKDSRAADASARAAADGLVRDQIEGVLDLAQPVSQERGSTLKEHSRSLTFPPETGQFRTASWLLLR